MSDFDDYFMRRMDSADDFAKKREDAFARLYAEPCMTPTEIGDRVVVAAGLLGMGYLWVRTEAEVVEIADTSVKIRWTGDDFRNGKEQWIHPALITDVIKAKTEPVVTSDD